MKRTKTSMKRTKTSMKRKRTAMKRKRTAMRRARTSRSISSSNSTISLGMRSSWLTHNYRLHLNKNAGSFSSISSPFCRLKAPATEDADQLEKLSHRTLCRADIFSGPQSARLRKQDCRHLAVKHTLHNPATEDADEAGRLERYLIVHYTERISS
jgi:hypothetical protein